MEYTPLLDSSNVAQKEWIRMAEDIGVNTFIYTVI